MDALVLVDKLDDMVHNAPSVPFRSQARVDREEMLADVRALQAAVRRELRDPESSRAWPVIARLEALVLAAEPVRLLGGVRVGHDEIYALLDELRAKLPEDLWAERHAP